LKYINSLKKKGYEVVFCGDVNTAHTEIDLARPKENVGNTGFLPSNVLGWTRSLTPAIRRVPAYHPNDKEKYTYWDMKTFARKGMWDGA